MQNGRMDCANFVFHHRRGPIYGHISEAGLRFLRLPRGKQGRPHLLHEAPNVVLGKTLQRTLEQYFAGIAVDFSNIPIDIRDATPFRSEVWLAARDVAWGKTVSYAGLAQRMGRSAGAARAVGQALGANPIPIIIPCHRILAAGDSLGGFSAGLEWKRELLCVEGHPEYT
jgi:methylated-DNA-[protein]-cysteine S-methyltransferase